MLKYETGHPGEDLVKRLKETEINDAEFLPLLQSLRAISAQSVAHRKLLVDYGLLDLLFSLVAKCAYITTASAVQVLDLLADIINGQSQVLNTDERSRQLTSRS